MKLLRIKNIQESLCIISAFLEKNEIWFPCMYYAVVDGFLKKYVQHL